MTPCTNLKDLPYLFQAGRAVPEIVQFVASLKKDLQQKGEWTPEAEQAFSDLLDAEAQDSAWQPE